MPSVKHLGRRRILRVLQKQARWAGQGISAPLKELEHSLEATFEATGRLIPETPKGLLRIVKQHAQDVFETEAGLSAIRRRLRRTLHGTLRLIPLDSRLLLKHGSARARHLNRQLAWCMAFIAGAVNAGGFLAVQSYTSHTTGNISRMADELALGHQTIALAMLSTVLCFCMGSFASGMLVSLGRRHRFRSHYALSLMIEAGLLLIFGIMGSRLQEMHRFYLPMTIVLLSFIMGMHNSVVTIISSAEVRTTHMTGIVTDLGLELSRLFYFNVDESQRNKRIIANRDKLKLYLLILVSFFAGGVAGALGFKRLGFKVTLLLAVFLILLAWRPLFRDLRTRLRLLRRTSIPESSGG